MKQETLSVMEYIAKYNELNRFASHQVAMEEKKMDHVEQGLNGSIKFMVVGHSFDNFQEMYQ